MIFWCFLLLESHILTPSAFFINLLFPIVIRHLEKPPWNFILKERKCGLHKELIHWIKLAVLNCLCINELKKNSYTSINKLAVIFFCLQCRYSWVFCCRKTHGAHHPICATVCYGTVLAQRWLSLIKSVLCVSPRIRFDFHYAACVSCRNKLYGLFGFVHSPVLRITLWRGRLIPF